MLAYPNEEAIAMLNQKLSAAQESLHNCEEDIDFLRQQITVCLLFSWFYSQGGPDRTRPYAVLMRENDACRRWKSTQAGCIIGI